MGVTIKDIAKKTGLSITTISLVLNKRESRIPERTRQIIESAAQELNYTPNQAARSLSTKKTNVIALVVPKGSFYNLADLISSVEGACRNAGYSLSISLPERDGDSCLEALQEMLRRGADGIIFDSSNIDEAFYQAYMDLLLKAETPISALAGVGAHLFSNSVIPDHRKGGALAASHLLELGHTRIGLIAGPRESCTSSDLSLGIEEALEQFHRDPGDVPRIFGLNAAASGSDGLVALIEQGCTGVIAGSNAIALGILRRAYERGIPIPQGLSLIGYGNNPHSAEFPIPLTTVSIHYDRIARKAVNLIKKLRSHSPAFTPELVPPSLIIRGSTAAVQPEQAVDRT
ncbi:MAG: LacI family transcriptional regulator [Treponema sp.]|jgi:LacI family transcriptional regulator|nr:LacI family transcriptional regulator [Treponema sp.]